MRRSIQPAAFIDALAAVQASQLGDTGPDRKTVLAFLRRYEKQAFRREKEEHRAQFAESVESNKTLAQQIQSIERFNTLLKTRINEEAQSC